MGGVVVWGIHKMEDSCTVWIEGMAECTTYRASSKVAGRIEALYVEEGDSVVEGALLYRLSTPELQAKLTQAEALERVASALDKEAIRGARQAQREAARNLWLRAEAGRQLATKSFERSRRLYREGVIAAQQYDEAEADYQAAVAGEEAARAQYNLVLEGASREELAAVGGRVEQARGGVAEVEAYLHDALVYAPASGEVTTLAARTGELVGSGFPVVSLIDLSDVWVSFNLRETLLPTLRSGTRLQGYMPALDQEVELEIRYIAPQADFATWSSTRAQGGFDIRTFLIKARPLHPSGLRPGMSVRVAIKPVREP